MCPRCAQCNPLSQGNAHWISQRADRTDGRERCLTTPQRNGEAMEVLMRLARVLKGGPLSPLYAPARTIGLRLLAVKATAESALARVVGAPLTLLPTGVQAKLKHGFTPVARLDYAAHEILLHVDSAGAVYRTRACRKEPETVRWIEEHV